jgi:hypothetical protein
MPPPPPTLRRGGIKTNNTPNYVERFKIPTVLMVTFNIITSNRDENSIDKKYVSYIF